MDGVKVTIKQIRTIMFIIPRNSRMSVVTHNNTMHCMSRTLSSTADSHDYANLLHPIKGTVQAVSGTVLLLQTVKVDTFNRNNKERAERRLYGLNRPEL